MEEKKLIGKITHYFNKIGVAVVELEDELNVGDEISIEGLTTNVRQRVESMQVEHKNIDKAEKGQSIGLKVVDRVREGDKVFKIVGSTI
ncbi:MAG: translation elongation factor-like protein [Candidatus Aenigmarchaeota archaeon]|nr:translation elongation factor-like protein [Candidatus Aenigmarchaeota archaeon]